MCGIFAYLNHLTPKTRKEVLDILIAGLKRLEYRGYDSAGVGVDGSTNGSSTVLVKSTGKGKNIVSFSAKNAKRRIYLLYTPVYSWGKWGWWQFQQLTENSALNVS